MIPSPPCSRLLPEVCPHAGSRAFNRHGPCPSVVFHKSYEPPRLCAYAALDPHPAAKFESYCGRKRRRRRRTSYRSEEEEEEESPNADNNHNHNPNNDDATLYKSTKYFNLFERGAEEIVKGARESGFSMEELKVLIRLWYSEGVGSSAREVSAKARKEMGERELGLSEVMWDA